MHQKGPWDKPVDHDKPADPDHPPKGLTNEQLEFSGYYRKATPLYIMVSWGAAVLLSIVFWSAVLWAIFH